MPLYEYECNNCDSTVEILVRRPDEQPECPGCGDEDLTKLMSVPSTPAVKTGGGSLPVASQGESCGAPRCCGGGCEI